MQRNPNDAQAYNMRGSVLGRAGRNQEALADFDRAIAIDANYAQAYANRGQVHRQMSKLDLALADYNKALALDQNYALAYLGRGQVYRAQGRALEALNDYNRAIQMSPEQRAGLLPARPALSGAGAAQIRDRRFLHRDRADPAAGRALHRARLEPSRAGDPKAAAGDLDDAVTIEPAESQRLDQPRPRLRAARREGEGGRLLRQGAQHQQGARGRQEGLRPRRRQGRRTGISRFEAYFLFAHDLVRKPVSINEIMPGPGLFGIMR